jgi:hypothetical protein
MSCAFVGDAVVGVGVFAGVGLGVLALVGVGVLAGVGLDCDPGVEVGCDAGVGVAREAGVEDWPRATPQLKATAAARILLEIRIRMMGLPKLHWMQQ